MELKRMLKRAEKVKVMKYKRMKEPLVSIVMSVYNENEKYLKALDDFVLGKITLEELDQKVHKLEYIYG